MEKLAEFRFKCRIAGCAFQAVINKPICVRHAKSAPAAAITTDSDLKLKILNSIKRPEIQFALNCQSKFYGGISSVYITRTRQHFEIHGCEYFQIVLELENYEEGSRAERIFCEICTSDEKILPNFANKQGGGLPPLAKGDVDSKMYLYVVCDFNGIITPFARDTCPDYPFFSGGNYSVQEIDKFASNLAEEIHDLVMKKKRNFFFGFTRWTRLRFIQKNGAVGDGDGVVMKAVRDLKKNPIALMLS